MTAFSSLKIAAFRNYLSARFFLTFSVQMQNLVISWLIYDITHDPLSLGIIGIAEIIPFLAVVFFAGHMADTYNRKKLVVFAVSLIILSSGWLLFIATNKSLFSVTSILTCYYMVVVIVGFARGFFGPASQSMAPMLVPIKDFANATTWNTTVFHFGAVVGPAFGGLLYGYKGLSFTMFFIIGLQAVSLVLFIKLKYVHVLVEKTGESIRKRLAEGLKFVFSNQIIIGSLTLDLFAVLFGGAIALLPIFAGEILHVGPKGLGLLRAAPALGAILTAVILMWKPVGKSAGKLLLACVAGFGLCMIGFALSTNFYLSLIILGLSGGLDNVSVVIRQTVVQLRTPDHMRGRVASVNSVFISLSNEIGSFESGAAAKLFGLIPSVIYGGLATIGVVAVTRKVAPELAQLDMSNDQ
jgi:MFS family permease